MILSVLESVKPAVLDYYELCKPNVVFLMLLTSAIGMFMAVPGMVPIDVLLFGNLGIALCAGAAAAINHMWIFASIAKCDALMIDRSRRVESVRNKPACSHLF